jgi:hypothetical protein
MFLVRDVGRTELDILQRPGVAPARDEPGDQTGTLFVATTAVLATGDLTARQQFERFIRTQVERRYARHGISPVAYDLQLI